MREEILDMAQAQLTEGGYDNLNFGKIAAALNTTRANVHYHFKNKESLALAATEKFAIQHREEIVAILKKNPGDMVSAAQDLEAHLMHELDSDEQTGGCVCSQIVRDANVPESIMQLSQSHFQELAQIMTKAFEESQDTGVITKKLPAELLAFMFGSMIMGLGQMAKINDGNPDFRDKVAGVLTAWIQCYKEN